jgi:hypothetical protein
MPAREPVTPGDSDPKSLGFPRFLTAIALISTALACAGGAPSTADGGIEDAGGQGDGGGDGFDDHTRARLDDAAAFDAIAARSAGLDAAKIVITRFGDATRTRAVYMDSNFYTLHDEWYWYRLLNGAPIDGDETEPVRGLRFPRIATIYAWARQQRVLPLDLMWAGDDRLYSPRFYRISLDEHPKRLGAATIVHVAARDGRPERWAFELEYTDDVTHDELVRFFEAIEASTGPAIHADLRWLVRSPTQEALARRMSAEGLRYGDRILRYADFVVPGDTEVYSTGLTAGRVRIVRAGESFEGGSPRDLLVAERLPDFLPPAAGLITGVPQTPLAHVNVLARNRGIPNVFLGGATDDPSIDQLARVAAPAVLLADADGRVKLRPISEAQYAEYLALLDQGALAVASVDLEGAPNLVDLDAASPDDVDRLRPILGGKNVGMLALLDLPALTPPERPLAVSIKPYVAHVAPLRARLGELLSNAEFAREARLRYFALEGREDYDAAFPSAGDAAYRDQVLLRYPLESSAGRFLREGGVRGTIRALPLDATFRAELEAAARAHFGHFAPTQGLRFRSSSNVEDIEGFNGAGLYDSNTGFIDAAAQPDVGDRKQTLEWAIKKTWASYWSFEAFEERRAERVDHLSGAMGVLVHARFDDDKERANAVLTFTIFPPEHRLADELIVNVQDGAVSVTNPDPTLDALPEVDQLTRPRGAETATITRRRGSNLVAPGTKLLSDAELQALWTQARDVAARWLARERRDAPAARAPRTLTLDYELRVVRAGWPALASGEQRPERLVLKQARTLEPGLRREVPSLVGAPIPRDVRVRARTVTETRCSGARIKVSRLEVYTDPLSPPDLGYATRPFVARVRVETSAALPELGWDTPRMLELDHLAMRATGGATLDVTATTPVDGLRTIAIDAGGRLTLGGDGSVAEAAACTTAVLVTTPRAFLARLVDAAD